MSVVVMLCSLRFTLISEPPAEDDDEDCVDIGYAYVSLKEILQSGRDLIGAEIPSQQPTVSLHLLVVISAKEVMFHSVCLFVCFFVCCLFVSRIVQRLLNQFSENSVVRWYMGHGKKHSILVVIQIVLGLQLGGDKTYSAICFTHHLFNSNNFAGSAALAEVYTVLSVILTLVSLSEACWPNVFVDVEVNMFIFIETFFYLIFIVHISGIPVMSCGNVVSCVLSCCDTATWVNWTFGVCLSLTVLTLMRWLKLRPDTFVGILSQFPVLMMKRSRSDFSEWVSNVYRLCRPSTENSSPHLSRPNLWLRVKLDFATIENWASFASA